MKANTTTVKNVYERAKQLQQIEEHAFNWMHFISYYPIYEQERSTLPGGAKRIRPMVYYSK